MKTVLVVALLTTLTLVESQGQAFQQEIPPADQRVAEKQAVSIFTSLREVTKESGQFVFPIYSFRKRIGYGVSLGDGKLLAKWSELAMAPNLYLADKQGKALALEPLGVYLEHDLAIVRVPGLEAPAVTWSDSGNLSEGSFLAGVDHRGEAAGLGVLSVPARSLREEDQGFLGIRMSPRIFGDGVMIDRVVRNSAAHKIGLRGGDLISRINGEEVRGFYELSSTLRKLKVGSEPRIEVIRDDETLTFQPTLSGRMEDERGESRQLQNMDQMSGSRSQKRDDFPNVFQSDMELEANDTGMPVVDLTGKIAGVVIARAGRISTLVIPGEVISELLKQEPEKLQPREWVPRQKKRRQPFQRQAAQSELERMRRALEQLERAFGR